MAHGFQRYYHGIVDDEFNVICVIRVNTNAKMYFEKLLKYTKADEE